MNKRLFWPVFIFITSSIFRIFFLDLIEFKFDEAYTIFLANNFFIQPYIAQYHGISSIGVHNFPLFAYLITALSIPSRDPQYLSFIIGLINTFSVVFYYFFVKKFYGNLTAVFSSLFLALSAWSIIYSRKVWGPDLVLPLLIPIYYFLHKLILEKNTKVTLPLFILLTLLIQLHLSGIYLLLASIIIFLLLKIRVNIKAALTGILVGLIPAIPYFLYNFSSIPFCPDCISFLSYQKAAGFDFYNFIRPFQFINGSFFTDPLGKDYSNFLNVFPMIKIFNIIFLIGSSLPLIAIAVILKYKRKFSFLVLYFLFIPLIYFLTRTASLMYYFIILSPIIMLFYAFPLSHAFNSTKKIFIKVPVLLALISLLVVNFIFVYSFFQYLSMKKNINGDYGTIFIKTKEYVQEQTSSYVFLPNFPYLKSYIYMFPNPEIIHAKLGEYFMQKNYPDFAITEFKKALSVNNKDTFSRANLAYLYITTGQIIDARNEINILKKEDKEVSKKLEVILKEAESKMSN